MASHLAELVTDAALGDWRNQIPAEGAPTMGVPFDFSNVTSNAIAVQLSEQGKLEKLWMLPAALGGKDDPKNVVYVPPGASALKGQFTDTLVRCVQAGLINKLAIVPEYRGNSSCRTRSESRRGTPTSRPASKRQSTSGDARDQH